MQAKILTKCFLRSALSKLRYSQLVQDDYKKCYAVLGVLENTPLDDVRNAFIKLAKKFHPDSGGDQANANKFKEVEAAFRRIKEKKSDSKINEDIVKELNIKHTAPQHRQYLSHDGVGTGNPYQRQQEYAKCRAINAANNVLEHRIKKNTADPNDKAVLNKEGSQYRHAIKTKYGFDRLVEDLIQESMSKGEFNNLTGSGKPLPVRQNMNPYVDFTTHKINQVLIENGFTPEWITLQKEIREELSVLKKELNNERSYLGPAPLCQEDLRTWKNVLKKYEDYLRDINKKITKYNLLVPILQKQMVLIKLNSFATSIIEKGTCKMKTMRSKTMRSKTMRSKNLVDRIPKENTTGLLHFICSLFNKL